MNGALADWGIHDTLPMLPWAVNGSYSLSESDHKSNVLGSIYKV